MENELQNPEVSLVGFFVDGCLVDEAVSDGPFASVFAANMPSGERIAIKVAKLKDEQSGQKDPGIFYTKAMAPSLGGPREVYPNKEEIIRRQAEQLMLMKGTAMVSVTTYGPNSATAQYIMPFVEGKTLREQIQTSFVPHKTLLDICQAMSNIASHPTSSCHNDLKPENIILNSHGGITLLDPGYFGRLKYSTGGEHPICITTPQYYPYLEPEDMLAFGYILWECMVGIHPLVSPLSMGIVNEHELGESLIRALETQEMLGNHIFQPLRKLPLPSAANLNITKTTEAILLKSIGLQLKENKLEVSEYYESFDQLYRDLAAVEAPEIWETAYRATFVRPRQEPQIEPNNIFGIKGLVSYINGRPMNRPFCFDYLGIFPHLQLTPDDKIPCSAWRQRDKIGVWVDAKELSHQYYLTAIFELATHPGIIYAALRLSGEETDEDRVSYYYLVRATSLGAIQTLSEDEFALASEEATKILGSSETEWDSTLIEKAFGKLEDEES